MGQVDSVGWVGVPVGGDAHPLVLAAVCLLFWSERAGPRGTTVWLVCAEKVREAAGGAFLLHHVLSEKPREETELNSENKYRFFFFLPPVTLGFVLLP